MARESAKERKEAEKQRRKDEQERLKALKREEIIGKLKKAEFLAGVTDKDPEGRKVLEKLEKELNTDFIPDLYDKAMDQMFDEGYYDAGNEHEEEAALEGMRDIDLQLMKGQEDKVGTVAALSDDDGDELVSDLEASDADEKLLAKQQAKKERAFENEVAQSLKTQVEQKEAAAGYDTWHVCDECHKAIPIFQFKFDC